MTAHDAKSPATTPTRATTFFAPLQREIDRIRAEFGNVDLPDFFAPTPRMDLIADDAGMELTVETPGLTEKDVRVELDGDVLTVSGDKKSENEERKQGYHLVERRFGSFSRSVRLPAGFDAGQLSASMKDGVLQIKAPRAKDTSAGKVAIPVKAG
ncbi:Hsp20/alpha crystallin family protein [Brevundimonas sp.]|uniref:Hsp20/alpha crystallin family protein n=1 Tax=Brevundimonas sp. TaxID=1871086 RepID=UPI00356237F7